MKRIYLIAAIIATASTQTASIAGGVDGGRSESPSTEFTSVYMGYQMSFPASKCAVNKPVHTEEQSATAFGHELRGQELNDYSAVAQSVYEFTSGNRDMPYISKISLKKESDGSIFWNIHTCR